MPLASTTLKTNKQCPPKFSEELWDEPAFLKSLILLNPIPSQEGVVFILRTHVWQGLDACSFVLLNYKLIQKKFKSRKPYILPYTPKFLLLRISLGHG